MIKPTIGRVVLLFARPGAINAQIPEPCLITWVHTDECINVGGFNANGTPFGATSVFLDQVESAAVPAFHAEWMPYQKGQAAKTEELERVVKEGFTKP